MWAGVKLKRFERLMLPHMGAAFNVANWLVRNEEDAKDAVQEAYLQAYRSFATYSDNNSRAWLLTIVRRTCFRTLRSHSRFQNVIAFDEALHSTDAESTQTRLSARDGSPEEALLAQSEEAMVWVALEELPSIFREVVVLRDIEEFSYQEIAQIIDAPIGTVMSRLTRARQRLRAVLSARSDERNQL